MRRLEVVEKLAQLITQKLSEYPLLDDETLPVRVYNIALREVRS